MLEGFYTMIYKTVSLRGRQIGVDGDSMSLPSYYEFNISTTFDKVH